MPETPKKILIVNSTYANAGLDTVLIAKEYASRGVDVDILTPFRSTEATARSRGIGATCIAESMRKFRFSEEAFQHCMAEYGLDFMEFAFDELNKPFQSAESVKKAVLASFRAVEKHLSENNYDCIYDYSHVLLDRVVYHVARKMGVLNLHGTATTPFGNMGWGRSWRWDDFVKRQYLEQDLTEEERKKVDEYLTSIKEHKPLVNDEALVLIAQGSRTRLLRDLYKHIFVNRRLFDNPLFPLGFFREALAAPFRSLIYKSRYDEPDYSEKYVYFPLQITTDASIAVFDPKYFRQDAVVEAISKSLPPGYELYVKEHPKGRGNIPLAWMKRITGLPNVKLVPVGISSHDLIKNCQALAVITTFTGWEGILYFKPVVIMGHPPFSRLGVTFDAESMDGIAAAVRAALDAGMVDEEKVRKAINASMKSVHEGHIYIMNEENPENVRKLVDSMLEEYDYFLSQEKQASVPA